MDPDSTDEMVDHLVDFFDQVATDYDSWAGGLHGRVAARLAEIASPKRGHHALDVACGTGMVAHLVAAKVKPGTVIGIDLSERMLSVARSRRDPNTQFVGMAAERLVFRPSTFDLVTMGEALAYLADPAAALEEAHRVLKPHGRLAVSCLRRSLSTPAQNLFFQGLVPLARRRSQPDNRLRQKPGQQIADESRTQHSNHQAGKRHPSGADEYSRPRRQSQHHCVTMFAI